MKKIEKIKLIILSIVIISMGLFVKSNTVFAAIDLVTIPEKESVQLTIYNSADITMVREVRTLTFKKGLNTIQFAWAGTLIDPTSLRLRFKTKKSKLDLLDTTYPPKRGSTLQWNIQSEYVGAVQIEISYFTSGLTWSADYVGITNQKEDKIDLKGYIKVVNNSGEDYPNASVRLVVGTINLVEKISDLANKSLSYRSMPKKDRYKVRRKFKRYMKKAEESRMRYANGKGAAENDIDKKAIIKEGLSEYFIFTIEGKETILTGWKKRLNSIFVENIPLKTIYKVSDNISSSDVYKYYEFKNKKYPTKKGVGQLGESPLPDGVFKIFSKKKNSDLNFIGSISNSYIPAGGKVKLNSGISKDIRIKRTLIDYKRYDINVAVNYYKTKYVKNYYERHYFKTVVINTLPNKSNIEIERRFTGNYKVKNLKFKSYKVDKYRFKYFPDVRGSSKKVFTYNVEVFNGTR